MEGLTKAELSSVNTDIKELLFHIEEQFEDHLVAINENTSEILSIYEGLSEVDSKLEKISERMERIEIFLKAMGYSPGQITKNPKVSPLTKKEKEIYLIIQTLSQTIGFINYNDVSRRTNLPEDMVNLYICGMMQKGIPFVKKYLNGKVLLKIEDSFIEKQEKENLLSIEQRTISSVL